MNGSGPWAAFGTKMLVWSRIPSRMGIIVSTIVNASVGSGGCWAASGATTHDSPSKSP